jgi:hypothetical protein
MYRPMIIATALTVAIILAITGATVISADAVTSKASVAPSFSNSIDVMKTMESAKDLPEEQYDAI